MSGQTVYADPRTAAFRATLDRLPDEIALAIGLHLYTPQTLGNGRTCVCGWAVREAIAREMGVPAESPKTAFVFADNECHDRFGGDFWEWNELFVGVVDDRAPLIEEALFDRVMAAATVTTKKRRSA